ncbi:hypothetical protein GCM10027589_08520 [Actinocorallia lasiicapitis]
MSEPTASQQEREALRRLLREKHEPIAIVGMGLRMPGGNATPGDLAAFLKRGGRGTGPTPPSRWGAEFTADPDAVDCVGKVRARGGGFLEDIERFDARFFNISPKEAKFLDPQQRLVLETAWEALEHANLNPAALRHGDHGVYLGAGSMDYGFELESLDLADIDAAVGPGVAHSAVSGRLSYFLGWRGPSVTVDTACSSSLVAVHMAVAGLRGRECGVALAGGVNAIHHPMASIAFSAAGMLAPDGRCKTFDESADGYARGEGCGVLVLKRLSDTLADGDEVIALIRGTAVRQDGESAGLTVPNGIAQQAVMRAALGSARLGPSDIQYVEAHGTGTPLGDPIEIGAISDLFRDSHSPENPVTVASVKTNLGHLEPAAGVAGIIKTALQLREGVFYPHLNLDEPSKRIPWAESPVRIPLRTGPWEAPVRRALVNSFGFTGTIATTVLEQAPAPRPRAERVTRPAGHLLTLSAKSPASLAEQVHRHRALLLDDPAPDPGDVCFTTNTGRSHFPLRFAAAADDRDGLVKALDLWLEQADGRSSKPGDLRRTAFVFAGQGAQYVGMGAALLERFPVFRRHLDACDELFAQHLGRSVKAVILGEDGAPDLIHDTSLTQPALFSLEYALARLWLSWGIRPRALVGHSIGEVAAAAVAGVFDLADAVALVAARASLMGAVKAPGAMLSVSAPAEDVTPFLRNLPDVGFAAFNAPGSCVLSGAAEGVERAAEALTAAGLRSKRLAVSHAFHSSLMDEVADEFRSRLEGITFREPGLAIISTLTGQIARPRDICTPEYWVRQMREPVRFADAIVAVAKRGRHAFVEIGPTRQYTALAMRSVDRPDDHVWAASTKASDPDALIVRQSLAALYSAGLTVDWAGYHAGAGHRKTALPVYPFDRRRHWLPLKGGRLSGRASGPARHPLLGSPAGEGEFRGPVSADRPAYLRDHRGLGKIIFPVAGFVEIVLALQDAVTGRTDLPVEDLDVQEPLFLPEDGSGIELVTRYRSSTDGRVLVEISSVSGNVERRHVTAAWTAEQAPDPDTGFVAEPPGVAEREYTAEELYAGYRSAGMDLGPEFSRIHRVVRHGDRSAADLRGDTSGEPLVHLPPAVLDAALQTVAAVADTGDRYLPDRIGRLRLHRKPRGTDLRAVLRLLPGDDTALLADLVLLDAGDPVCTIEGLRFRRLAGAVRTGPQLVHEPRWETRPVPVEIRSRSVLTAGGPGPAGLAEAAAHRGVGLAPAGAPGPQNVTDVCWFWRPVAIAGSGVEALRAECEANYRDLLALVADLEERRSPARLWLVTEAAQHLPGDPGGDEAPAAATLWGFGRALSNEYPARRVTLVDIEPGGAEQLVREWQADDGEDQIAFRNGLRHVQRLVPAKTAPAEEPVEIEADAAYLVTGGLGGLGLAAARALAERGARFLVLTGRSADPTALAGLGLPPETTVVAADVAEPADVDRIGAAITATGRPLAGIVHAAGVLADAMVPALTWESFDTVFRSKVYGTRLLQEKLAAGVGFFVGYSSLASLLGPPGQANYAAANAYLDAALTRRAASGAAGLSVNWGPWAGSGMATALGDMFRRSLERQGIRLVRPDDGLRALFAALGRRSPQVLVGEVDWTRLAASTGRPHPFLEHVTGGAAVPALTHPDRATLDTLPPNERTDRLVDYLRARVAQILGFDGAEDIDPGTEFSELGLDSLAAVLLKNDLEAFLGTTLSASLAFDHPSPSLLGAHLSAELATA